MKPQTLTAYAVMLGGRLPTDDTRLPLFRRREDAAEYRESIVLDERTDVVRVTVSVEKKGRRS